MKYMKENLLIKPFYNHEKMFSEIETYLKSCKKTNFWNEEAILSNIKSILNHYMESTPPTKFRYNGRTYTPKGFMRYVTRINPSNYVDFMKLLENLIGVRKSIKYQTIGGDLKNIIMYH